MAQTNLKGREFTNGNALSDDIRTLIVADIEQGGGQKCTREVPRGIYTSIAGTYRISKSSVKNVWIKFCEDGSSAKRPHGGGNKRKLQDTDL
jgi:hypothetical protein